MLNAKNNAETILSASINSSVTSLTVAEASVLPVVPFVITIDNEIMTVTNVVGNVLTVTRGAESTTPAGHLAGVPVENRWTAGMHKEIVDDFTAHLAEITSQAISVTRDLSILGNQVISTMPGRKIKSVLIFGMMKGAKHNSRMIIDESNNKYASYIDIANLYSYEYEYSSNNCALMFSSDTLTKRTGANVTIADGSITLNWSIASGDGVTGTVSLYILVSYHD